LCARGDIEDWVLLLRIVQRFESYHSLHSTLKKRGPQIGTVPKNDLLREKIKKIANKQMCVVHGFTRKVVADFVSLHETQKSATIPATTFMQLHAIF
jgi:hypothetical protein